MQHGCWNIIQSFSNNKDDDDDDDDSVTLANINYITCHHQTEKFSVYSLKVCSLCPFCKCGGRCCFHPVDTIIFNIMEENAIRLQILLRVTRWLISTSQVIGTIQQCPTTYNKEGQNLAAEQMYWTVICLLTEDCVASENRQQNHSVKMLEEILHWKLQKRQDDIIISKNRMLTIKRMVQFSYRDADSRNSSTD